MGVMLWLGPDTFPAQLSVYLNSGLFEYGYEHVGDLSIVRTAFGEYR